MLPLVLAVLLLAGPALPTPSSSAELEVRGQRTPRDTKQDSIKVVISEGCATQGDPSDRNRGGKEIDLLPGSPLVLTHNIKLVPSGPGSGSCGCEADSAALRERLERLEREVSGLLEKCGGPEGNCCTSKESKGAGCSIKPDATDCPNECSDQGRCVDGRCVCFPGFSGPDCSDSNCPGNCNDRGRCVNGQCVCDPGFTGPDCSQGGCPDDCNDRGRCVNGRCVCDGGFTGPSCSDESCPGNCNRRGRCVNGQCVCDPGFTGPDCSQGGCPDDCNDHGMCVNGRCVCDGGFTGPSCSDESCPGNCNSRGRCVNGQCVCDPGFAGPDCLQRPCPDDCNDRGRCVDGRCVCDSGFTGADCSEVACLGNCNNRGRCVDGQCVCDEGFAGDGCSERSCPDDCNDRGRCVDGRCVCTDGFSGADCSEVVCPGNCNNRGRCVNGQCVCDDGFAGADCSEKACPNNCSNRGKCVNGKCVCAAGFAGPDCTAKGCPNNCSNKGRCVRGSCVCRRGFTGPDCSQCQEGMTGPNCDTAMSAVSQLRTQDITETSVTLVWSPPAVQYETYYITFSSQKESDQQVVAQVSGDLTTFTQTGLAAGQEYSVVLVGEVDGRRGTESVAEFMTLISGPANLHVVKTTSTSAVVQWEQSQGEIDRYRLTITPNDGAERSQELTIPAAENSAHIRQLEAGRLYDIVLVAEKGASRSEPATAQAVPGETLPKVTTAALTMRVTLAPGQDVADDDRNSSPLSPELRGFDHQGRREDANSRGLDDPNRSSSASVIARTKPVLSKAVALNGTRPKVAGRPTLSRKVPGPRQYNTTRAVPGGRKFVPGPFKKAPVVAKRKEQTVPRKPNPGAPIIGDAERRDDKGPAVMSGTDSETNGQSGSEEPTAAVGTKEQPDVGRPGRGNDTDPVPPEPTGSVQSQEKKCMNKIKVTHFRLPQRDGGRGCRGDGTVLAGNTLSSDPDTPPSAETDLDYSPDPLQKLLTDTFDSLNVTTFSVHLSKPSDLGADDAETVRKLILRKLKPLSSSSSLYPSTSDSFSSPSLSLPSPVSSASTAAPLSSHASRSLTSSPPSRPSSSPSGSDVSDPLGSNELTIDNSKSTTDSPPPPEDRKPSGEATRPLLQHTPPKRGYVRRPHPYLLQNKTRLYVRVPHRPPPPRLNLIPKREPETERPSTSELSSHSSEESSSEEVNVQVKDTSGDNDGTAAPASSSGVDQNQKTTPTERGRIPSRRPPPKGGYFRRPFQNMGPFQNRTRPNMRPLTRPMTRPITRPLTHPSQLLDAETGTQKEPVFATALPATSSPSIVKDSHPSDTRPVEEENEGRIETRISTASSPTEFNQTVRGGGVPSSRRPNTKVGYFRRPQGFGRSFTNRTRTNQVPAPHRGPGRKPFPMRKLNTGSGLTVGSPTSHSGRDGANENSQNQLGDQDVHRPRQGVLINRDLTVGSQTSHPGRDGSNENPEIQLGDQDVHRPRQGVLISRGLAVGSQTSHLGRDGSNENPEMQLGEQDVHRPRQGVLISRGLTVGSQTSQPGRDGSNENPEIQLGEQDVHRPRQEVLIRQSGEQEITKVSPVSHSTTVRPETNDLGNGDNVLIQKEETSPTGSDTHIERIDPGKNTGTALGDKPTLKQSSSYSRVSRPATPPKRHPPTRTRTAQQHSTNMRQYNGGSQREQDPKRNHTGKRVFFTKTEQTGGLATDAASSGVTREPLDFVGVRNRTSDGFTLVWDSPEDKYKNFVVTRNKVVKDEVPKQKEQDQEQEQDKEGGSEDGHAKHQPTKEPETESGTDEDDNRLPESFLTQVPKSRSSVIAKPSEGDSNFKKVIPGSARSFRFEDLPPQTDYTLTLLGKGPGLLSRLHKLVISTGPEPPSNIVFSKVTENSLTVSWTKPKSSVDGFKVTYTHADDGEPVSVSVDSEDSTLGLSQLPPGSTYEVTVISTLGLDESDPIRDFVTTLPDPPTDLRAVNVTDSTALLLWRPALAAVDKYAIVYGSGTDSELKVTVSGNAAEQQLSGLEGSTTYTVTITSQLGSQESSEATTSFTTTGGSGSDGDGPRDLQATNVSPRTALLSWKPPSNPASSYRLTYETEGQRMKEVIVDAMVTQVNLTRLHSGSTYRVQLQAETGGRYTSAISTDFTTGTLRFPFPTDCSQELLNGIYTSGEVEIFPRGKEGTPVLVSCDMETDGGGWTVFQRRKDGSVDFFRKWKEYTAGFGDVNGEFWLGLDSLHNLTTMTRMILRVDLRDGDESVFAQYSTFEVAKRNYRLTVGGYSGTAGDSLSYHNNRIFSTKDRDPATFITRCAMSYRGGWWYKNCHEANLNGLYGIEVKHQGVIWTSWKGKEFSIPFTEMKMRPAAFRPPARG